MLVQGQRVILDADLAELYGVTVGRLNEAVKRNRDRFPADFMFQLTREELKNSKSQIWTPNLKSQNAISSSGWGGRRHPPYTFTEQGVAMLSSVLNKPQGDPCQHRDYESIRPTAANSGQECRPGAEAQGVGKEIRCSV